MTEAESPNKPIIPECIKCGNTTITTMEVDHIWLISMLGLGRKMAPNLDLTDLQKVIRMRENKSYLCPEEHMGVDRLKEARFFNRDICDKKRCPILTPNVTATKNVCPSADFCNATNRELIELDIVGKRAGTVLDLSDPASRGNPVALATFIRESYPITANERYQLTHIDGIVTLQEEYLRAVDAIASKQTGLSPELTIGYIKSGFVVSEHIQELKEQRIPLLEKERKSRTDVITVPELPYVPQRVVERFPQFA